MNYTIAFYKLVSLKALIEGEYWNLYQPRKFTTNIIKDDNIRNEFYKIFLGLEKKKMISNIQFFIKLFLDIVEKGKITYNLDTKYSQFKDFLLKLEEKYL